VDLEKLVLESVRQKRKYWSKVCSLTAKYTNMLRSQDIYTWMWEWAWKYGLLFNHINISTCLLYSIDPSEAEPMNLDFTVRLPSFEEWLAGFELIFEKIDLGELWRQFLLELWGIEVPPIFTLETLLTELFRPEYMPKLPQKLIVGKTKYGEGYVDPPVIREFLRATFLEHFKRREDFERLRTICEEYIEKLGIHQGPVEAIFNRLALLHQILFENFVLGYGILGVSKLTPRGSKSARVPMVTWRREAVEVEYTRFQEASIGFILGITPLGFGILVPREDMYRYLVHLRTGAKVQRVLQFLDWRIRRMIDRVLATAQGFGNYQKLEEKVSLFKSDRADQYHQLMLARYLIENMVQSILEQYNVDPYRANMYRRAVLQLIGHRKKRHRWGYAAYKAMTEEEFKTWWIDHWKRQGLNPDVLEKLYEVVSRWLPQWRSQWSELGQRVQQLKKRLAQLLRS